MISADEKLFSLSLSWKMFFEFFHVFIMWTLTKLKASESELNFDWKLFLSFRFNL
jgi:hypothetical protein